MHQQADNYADQQIPKERNRGNLLSGRSRKDDSRIARVNQ